MHAPQFHGAVAELDATLAGLTELALGGNGSLAAGGRTLASGRALASGRGRPSPMAALCAAVSFAGALASAGATAGFAVPHISHAPEVESFTNVHTEQVHIIYLTIIFLNNMAAMKPTNDLAILEKNNTDRMTVVLPVHKFSWPTENIAFFCSTGQSGVKEFDGTYFPTLGVYVDDRTTPMPAGTIHSSITLVRNYFVKTSSISFLRHKEVYEMQEWIFLLLKDYCESQGKLDMFQMSLNDVRGKPRTETETRQLTAMYKELDLIYKCLSPYFTDIGQVFLSISLSDTFGSGVWLSQLKGFADYMKSISGKAYEIRDTKGISSDDTLRFLTRNSAQCDFTTLRETLSPPRLYKVNTSTYMYDVLYRNYRSLEIEVNALDRVLQLAAEREKREAELAAKRAEGAEGGKSRRYKRKRKSRKITTRFRYV